MIVRFALVAEGGAEGELVPHLQDLCVRSGADEAIGTFPDLGALDPPSGREVDEKVGSILRLDIDLNLVFVYRDADSPDSTARRTEIRDKLTTIGEAARGVPVVPVQEFEAWLLADPQALRDVVGKPRGRADMGIPPLARIESTAHPKEILMRSLEIASEASGRRLRAVKRAFNSNRRILAARLDIDGPVGTLPSWRQLVTDIDSAVARLRLP